MRTITTLIAACMLMASNVQADGYQQAMTDALVSFSKCKTVKDYTTVANTFKRISNAEKDEWLPLYYHAQCYILMGFRQSEGAEKQDAHLDEAQRSIDEMLALNDQESEVYALQSLLHTARLVIDPMNRGQQMMAASGKAIEQALALNPENPRAQYMLLSNEVGMAQFFGKDVTDYCERIIALYGNWDKLNESPAFYPSWGKNEVAGLLENCNQ